VVCDEANGYEKPINATALLDMGASICTGTLLNNVSQDLTPYFLTANFCVAGLNANIFRFYFNYEATSCLSSTGSMGPYAYGSTLLTATSGYANSMSALLEITDDMEVDWGAYYSGWDASNTIPMISCGVHHTDGNPKIINFDNDNATNQGWDANNTHWGVYWDDGGTGAGAAGSGLFNNQLHLVGQLSGGPGTCGSAEDLYGKFSYNFNDMKAWLDPDDTGTLILNGTYNVDFQLDVPGEFSTIQSAIDYAVDGATVLVAPGTYSGVGNIDLNFDGKAITVMSEAGAEQTIIDGGGTDRGFTFEDGEDSTSVLDGFTITNGSRPEGGGIYCYYSSPTIKNCIIRDCYANQDGGGVYI